MPTTKQRRQTARRRLERQLLRRAEAARKQRVRYLAIGAMLSVLLVVGAVWLIVAKVGGTDQAAPRPTAQPSASTKPTAAPIATRTFSKAKRAPRQTLGPCRYAETAQSLRSPYTRDVGLPPDPARTPTTGTEKLALATTQGAVVITLDRAKAPCAVQSLGYLASKRFYDGSPCHRMSTSASLSMLQCGDPSGTGQGGPTYNLRQEVAKTARYAKGVVAMANTGQPNSTGSQFFLIFADSQLSPDYSIVGTVTTGMDVLEKIRAAGDDGSFDPSPGGGKPILGVTIGTARVTAA
ncbi:MAG TPA: peptidylprolyl isomerase [Mycobacteriales bacterium]|nr:peptidylprolyl isomerase [Mycobacteriales bacterium]